MPNGVDTSATIATTWCPHRPNNPPLRYDLPGPQIEPDAGFWIDGVSRICVPTFEEVQAISEPPNGAPPVNTGTLPNRLVLNFEVDFPYDPSQPGNTGRLEEQLGLLFQLAEARDRPYPKTVGTLTLTPLSRFLQLQPTPFGAIFDTRHHDQVPVRNVVRQHERIVEVDATIVSEGRELARMFENETPGLYHRHALNWALFNRVDVSPPRQARIWAALDIAVYTALTAAWYYKWVREPYNLLVRPKEYELCVRKQNEFVVHYNRRVQNDGQDPNRPDLERKCPLPSPGTPRHPAWPSGHSTYSAAASHLLEFIFSPDTLKLSDSALYKAYPPQNESIDEPGWFAAELRRLADNIGHARLWGGVHWLDDHVAGQKIGRAAAEAVIKQLQSDCVPKLPAEVPDCNSTDRHSVPSGRLGTCETGQDTVPPLDERAGMFLSTRGVT